MPLFRYRREKEQELAAKQAVQQVEEQKRGAQRRAEVLKFLQMVRQSVSTIFCLYSRNCHSDAITLVANPRSFPLSLTCMLPLPHHLDGLEEEVSARDWAALRHWMRLWRACRRW